MLGGVTLGLIAFSHVGSTITNKRSQLSHLAEPLWTDPGLKIEISVCDLIFILKTNQKSAGREGMDKSSSSLSIP